MGCFGETCPLWRVRELQWRCVAGSRPDGLILSSCGVPEPVSGLAGVVKWGFGGYTPRVGVIPTTLASSLVVRKVSRSPGLYGSGFLAICCVDDV